MADTQAHFGVSGMALVRAADAMLRALGGAEVSFLFPATGLPDDASVQLGLVDPQVEEVKFAPVVVRNLPTSNSGPRRRLEYLLPASVVRSAAVERNVVSGEALLNGALGVLQSGEMLHIEGIVTECFAGTAYLYRVTAVE